MKCFLRLLSFLPFLIWQPVLPAFVIGSDPFGPSLNLSVHLRAAAGVSSADPARLATHGHDPFRNLSLQSLELATLFKPSPYFESFSSLNTFLDPAGKPGAEFEEAYLRAKQLPWGLTFPAGRFLNLFGLNDNAHQHSWDFIDASLVTTTFLGEEGLITEGAEVGWMRQGLQNLGAVVLTCGKAREHDHSDPSANDDHSHGADDARFSGGLLTARVILIHRMDDFRHHTAGLNCGIGKNGYGRSSRLFSADYEYNWRENGSDSGGAYFRAKAAAYHRHAFWAHGDDPSERGATGQSGTAATAIYGFGNGWESSLRFGWTEGVAAGAAEHEPGEIEHAFHAEERFRFSAAVTRLFAISTNTNGHLRLQYNHDKLRDGEEDSLWLQLGFSFGHSH